MVCGGGRVDLRPQDDDCRPRLYEYCGDIPLAALETAQEVTLFRTWSLPRHFQQDLAATELMRHPVLDVLEGVHARHRDYEGAVGY
jgi:hypothetical protein